MAPDPLLKPPKSTASRRWRTWLGPLLRIPTPAIFGVCVAVALVVAWWLGALREVVGAIGGGDVRLLTIAAPIYVASLALLCYRWHLLVRMAQGVSNLPRASEAFLTSVVINYAAPIGLAVPSRAVLTKRALGLDAYATGTIAIWEIGVDVIVLGCGCLLWLMLAQGSAGAVGDELTSAIATYAAIGGAAIALTGVGAWWMLRKPERRARIFTTVTRIVLAPKKRPREAALALAVTIAYWLVQGAVLALRVSAFGIDASFVFVLGLTSLPILVGMLSPIPGGAGIREALMYAIARLADVPAGPVIAAALVYRFALFGAIPILYGLTRWWIHHNRNPFREADRV
ncbi:hypothetical protein BH20CHL3_BH20CHL3_07240 [soil metagenome]